MKSDNEICSTSNKSINLEKGKFNIVFGGQAGSEGKGKVSCFIAREHLESGIALVFACNHMPNAGHTFRDGDYKYVAGQLPTPAVFNAKKYGLIVPVILGPGSAINIKLLEKEMEQCDLKPGFNLFIHPNAGIVTDDHLKLEGSCLDNVSSTKKGGGACLAAKVMRQGNDGVYPIARDLLPKYLRHSLSDTSKLLNKYMSDGYTVLFEGAQGFDLDINHGLDYPYVTSRMSNVSQALAESGVSPTRVGRRIMVIRPYPIRVGNAYDENGNLIGTSGKYASDNVEISWDEVKRLSGAPVDTSLIERTTVTNKIRRVFTFSGERYQRSIEVNDPTDIVLSFTDHVSYKLYGVGGKYRDLEVCETQKICDFLDKNNIDVSKLKLLSTGPDDKHIIHV